MEKVLSELDFEGSFWMQYSGNLHSKQNKFHCIFVQKYLTFVSFKLGESEEKSEPELCTATAILKSSIPNNFTEGSLYEYGKMYALSCDKPRPYFCLHDLTHLELSTSKADAFAMKNSIITSRSK